MLFRIVFYLFVFFFNFYSFYFLFSTFSGMHVLPCVQVATPLSETDCHPMNTPFKNNIL